ncbi:MFS transporter [Arthrobacter sp. ISL-30]|uniref:MFS transporter n=1 Tax=Arthrobacter sp. ISL-30 TaxID=2819109 RepID=UPI001BE543D6|nr:MFS transporter [Arthrobacter sp. ISL-30]MBT2514219.1 MFS transporter [Arthrobacter sp. ISL-30]
MTINVASPTTSKATHQHTALAIFALAMGGFAIGVTEFTMMGLLKEIEAGLGISTPEAGNLISAYALGVVVGAPLFAAFGARLPRKTLAMGLMLFLALANLTSFIAPDYGTMLVTRFGSGLPHGAFFGVAAVIAASLVAPTRRGWAISMVMAGLTVSNVVGVPAATWLGQALGWRLLFVVVGAMGFATVAMIWKSVPFEPAHPDASIRRELGALKRIQVWLALLIGIIGFGGFFATYTYIAHTMTSVAGMPQAIIPLVVALYGLGMVFGNIVGGRIADKSVMGTIYWVLPGIAAALAVYAIAAQWAWALVMVFVVGAIGSMLVPPLQTRLLDASPDAPSLASSLNHSALNVANALGAFLGGVVIAWGWGYTAPALVGAVLALLGLGIAAISGLLERRKPLSAKPL